MHNFIKLINAIDVEFLDVKLQTHNRGRDTIYYLNLFTHSPTADPAYEYVKVFSASGSTLDSVARRGLTLSRGAEGSENGSCSLRGYVQAEAIRATWRGASKRRS